MKRHIWTSVFEARNMDHISTSLKYFLFVLCVFSFDFILLDLVFVISYCNRPYEHAINVLISSTHKKSFGRWKM